MTKLNQDIDMFQGEDKILTIPVTDSDGDPLDMTDATVAYKVFNKKAGDTAVIEKSTGGAGIILVSVDGTNDGVRVTLDGDDTNSLLPTKYYHECRVTLDGNSEVVMEGRINLRRSRTTA